MYNYTFCSDSAVIVKIGNDISPETVTKVRRLHLAAEDEAVEGVLDFIPSYNELMICIDPLITGPQQIIDRLKVIETNVDNKELPEPSEILIPVLYGGESGPDIGEVASLNRLSESEVIEIHSSASYLIYMLGFTPGFCYLGGMDERIAAPRKSSPRLVIEAGSVGIAGNQTGIYPLSSPGGWQLIGRTPLKLFDSSSLHPFLFRQGDYIRFYSIDNNEYKRISDAVQKHAYSPVKTNKLK